MIDDEIIDNYITGLYIGTGCLEPQGGWGFYTWRHSRPRFRQSYSQVIHFLGVL